MRPAFFWLLGWFWVWVGLLWPTSAAAPLLDGEPLDFKAPPAAASPIQEEVFQATIPLLQEYSLSLPCDPKSGWGWRLVAYDRDYLELQARRCRLAAASPTGQAQEVFVFLPRKTGQTRITLHYQRPFDRRPTTIRIYQLSIR